MAWIGGIVVWGHVGSFKILWNLSFHDFFGEGILILVGAVIVTRLNGFGFKVGFKF